MYKMTKNVIKIILKKLGLLGAEYRFRNLETTEHFLRTLKVDELNNIITIILQGPLRLYVKRVSRNKIIHDLEAIKMKYKSYKIYYLSDFIEVELNGVDRIENVSELKDKKGPKVVFLALENDSTVLKAIQELKKIEECIYTTPLQVSPVARYFHRNIELLDTLKKGHNIFKAPDQFYDCSDLENIAQAIEITKHLKGDYVEIGTYKGKSAFVAADYIAKKNINRICYFFDTYEGFNYETARNSKDSSWYQTHQDISMEAVQNLLKDYPHARVVRLNIIDDDLPKDIKKISVCNIDVDIYEAVLAALKKVSPYVQVKGIIIVEDQGHTPRLAGAYCAFKEFIRGGEGRKYIPIQMASGQAFLIKVEE